MGSRWARVARGVTAAAFATFVAALSHILGGGAAPTMFAILATLVISAAVCSLLAGRTLSMWRLAASITFSQALFHGVFSGLGMPVIATHTHHPALSGVIQPAMAHVHDSPVMWIAHAIAALVTVVAFRHAEQAFWGLAFTARLFIARLLATTIPLSPFPRPIAMPVERRFVPRDLTVLLSSMRHRGPPELSAA